MARLRLFGPARQAAGTATVVVPAADVRGLLATAEQRFGPNFTSILRTAQVWVNGEPARLDQPVDDQDEVAVLPPVSGG